MEVFKSFSTETFSNKFQLQQLGNQCFDKFPNRDLTQQKLKINKRKGNMKESLNSDHHENHSTDMKTPLITVQTTQAQNGAVEDTENKPKKKKKWEKIEPSEIGINLTLFPRPVRTTDIDIYESRYVFIEQELEQTEILIEPKYGEFVELEGNTRGCVKYLRANRDRKVVKVHKQVKTKHCKSVLNNKGRKSLYINHRVYKLMELDINRLCYMPSQKRVKNVLKREATSKDNYRINPNTNRPHQPNSRPAPVQCLAHAIHKDNLPSDFETAVANLLMNMQHRDLTPEDYDLLLRLDERVAPKTVSENKLNTFKTDKVENNDDLEVCSICMELYELGQIRKYLPCDHKFHCDCIDAWLKNSSMNCPIDNLPIDS